MSNQWIEPRVKVLSNKVKSASDYYRKLKKSTMLSKSALLDLRYFTMLYNGWHSLEKYYIKRKCRVLSDVANENYYSYTSLREELPEVTDWLYCKDKKGFSIFDTLPPPLEPSFKDGSCGVDFFSKEPYNLMLWNKKVYNLITKRKG